MKHLYSTILIVLAFTTGMHAQPFVLLEQFTSNSNIPESAINPTFDQLCLSNDSAVKVIKYHVGWPGQGSTFYGYNIGMVESRRNFYGVSLAPWVIASGNFAELFPSAVDQSLIDSWAQWASQVVTTDLVVTQQVLSSTQVELKVNITALAPLGNNVVLHVVLVERYADSPTPAVNGETDFYWVARDMIPNANGTSIPPLSVGGQDSASFVVSLDPINTNIDTMDFVVFLQDASTKTILGTASQPSLNPEVCQPPSALGVMNVESSSADVVWNAGTGLYWNVEYGAQGFALGTGTSINGLPFTTVELNGLAPGTTYDVYVQDSCGVGDNSGWTGPFSFTTNLFPCQAPDSLQLTNVGSTTADFAWTGSGGTSWLLEWGSVGFTLGSGNPVFANTTSATIVGLLPLTSYEVYVREICDSVNSDWTGPLGFNTAPPGNSVGIGSLSEADQAFRLFPNPSNGTLQLILENGKSDQLADIVIHDQMGRSVYATQVRLSTDQPHMMNLQQLPAGVYSVAITSSWGTATSRLLLTKD